MTNLINFLIKVEGRISPTTSLSKHKYLILLKKAQPATLNPYVVTLKDSFFKFLNNNLGYLPKCFTLVCNVGFMSHIRPPKVTTVT